MKTRRLVIKGMLAVEHVDLDLGPIGPGLVAIVGENGQGKTSILDLSLGAYFRTLPSRAENPIASYATGRDSFVDVETEVDGRGVYRARLNLDSVTGKGEAVLELNGRPLNDGKVSTFDAAVAREFPPLEVFLASAFSAQNRNGSFVSLGRRERKELFAKLLGLQGLEAKAETSRKAAAVVDRAVVELRAIAGRLRLVVNPAAADTLTRETTEFTTWSEGVDRGRVAIVETLRICNEELAAARVDAEAFREAQRSAESLRDRVDSLEHERQGYEFDLAHVDTELASAIAAAESATARIVAVHNGALAALETPEARRRRADERIRQIDAKLATDLNDRDERLRNNRGFMADEDAIRAAAVDLAESEIDLEVAREAVQSADAARDSAGRELEGARARKRRSDAEVELLAGKRARVAWLDGVPCKGAGEFASCQFLGDAVEARKFVQERAAAIERDADVAANALTSADAELARRLENLQEARGKVQAIEQRQTAARPKAALLARLEAAVDRVRELENEIAILRQTAVVDRANVEDDVVRVAAEAARERAKLEGLVTRANLDLADELAGLRTRFETRREGLINRDAGILRWLQGTRERLREAEAGIADDSVLRRAEGLEADLQVLQRAAGDLERDHGIASERRQVLERRAAEFAAAREELGRTDAGVAQLERDLVEWTTLGRILGPDGLQVLEIDGAGPGVSARTNDLLEACYGSRFQVEIVTQEAKASGKGMKESFELKVYDAERGGEPRDLDDLSGGELVIVDEAIKSAIALFVNERNEFPVRTCWRDETTGALDAANSRRYIDMLRRVQARGGFHQVLFVTHDETAAGLADAQIVVANGGAEIVYPPFDPIARSFHVLANG